MKIRHWVPKDSSGLSHLALAVAEGERRLGHDVDLVDAANPSSTRDPQHIDADVHCIHAQCALADLAYIRTTLGREPRVVFYSHGIPEDTLSMSVNDVLINERPQVEDIWALTRYWLARADAFVVFNARQQALFQTMAGAGRVVDCVPFGVQTEFWADGPRDVQRLKGAPAVWTGENQSRTKWALDAILAWPFVQRQAPDAQLHAHYIPFNLHRWFVDIANTNGASYTAIITPKYYPHPMLRDLWRGCDFLWATTRNGDPTCLSQQAEATGLPVISYEGNPYASYWVPEGHQQRIADHLVRIFRGEVQPRADKTPIPTLEAMARATVAVYERVAA